MLTAGCPSEGSNKAKLGQNVTIHPILLWAFERLDQVEVAKTCEFALDVASGTSAILIDVLSTGCDGIRIAAVGLLPVFGNNGVSDSGQKCFTDAS